jgi:hypothetical protein
MKLEILSIFLVSLVYQATAQHEIWCNYTLHIRTHRCLFREQVVGPNQRVSIRVEPPGTNVDLITEIEFQGSSIYSPPPELFTRFINVTVLLMRNQTIRDVPPGTFRNAGVIESVVFDNNRIANGYLRNIFEGARTMQAVRFSQCFIMEVTIDAFKGSFYPLLN